MNTATIYTRVSPELKEKIVTFAKSTGKQQSEVITELLNLGFLYPDSNEKLSQIKDKLSEEEEKRGKLQSELENVKNELTLAQQKLDNAQRAKVHLERVLNTEVGKCTAPNCGAQINLYNFAFQQCPYGHPRKIELYDEYKKTPGIGDVLVTGLAIIGGVALAAELLGGESSNRAKE